MRAGRIALLIAAAAHLGCAGADDGCAVRVAAAPAPRAIVVTVDGLMPETYTAPDRHGLAVPTLRGIVAGGAWARGARPVMPTVTYPTHTTLATGVDPGVHGITGNRVFDPLEKNREGWHWYSEDIRVPALWDAVEASGRSAALINWPVTVGARARYLVPEYWRAGTAEDQKLLRLRARPRVDAGQFSGLRPRPARRRARPGPPARRRADRCGLAGRGAAARGRAADRSPRLRSSSAQTVT